MLINTEKMIPVTKLQKLLTQKLREVSESGDPLYVLRNNEMAAVIVSADEYEMLKDAEDALDHLEIAEVVEKRTTGHGRRRNIPWEKIKRKHGL